MPSALLPTTPTAPTSTERETAAAVELVVQMRRDYAEAFELYDEIDDVVYSRIKPRLPKGYRKIGRARTNPLAVYFVNTISAALTVDQPRVQFPVVGLGERAQENSTLREHFFDASWERQQEDAKANLFRRFVRPLVAKGSACIKTVERTKSAWASYGAFSKQLTERMTAGDLAKLDGDSKDRLYHAQTEAYKREQAPYPIKSIDVPPETFMKWQGEDGMTVAVEDKRVPYLEALTRFGAGLDGNGRVVADIDPSAVGQSLPPEAWRSAMSGTSTITLREIWTWDRVRYLMTGPGQSAASSPGQQGTIVRTVRHRYGDPVTKTLRGPYFHCLGTTTESRLPQYAGLGMLFGFLDLFTMLDELLTIQQINAVMTGLAAYKRNQPAAGGLPGDTPGEDGLPRTRQPEIITPGGIYPYDIGPVEQPRGGAALGETIGQVREFLEFILPRVLQGVVDTTDSGYQLAQAVRLGKIAFQPLVDNMKLCFAERVGFESRLIEDCIGETVYAWGEPAKKAGRKGGASAGMLAIGPDDLNGVHKYRVLISPDATNEQLIDVRKHSEMVKDKFESLDDAREALGQNPEEVERKILLQETKDDPEIRALLKARIKQKLGVADQQAQQQADQALAQGQPQGAPGAALQGAGQVFQPGQTMPIEPTVPGQQVGIPSVPAGAPGGAPPPAQTPPPMGFAA